jgi:hypothetical protein
VEELGVDFPFSRRQNHSFGAANHLPKHIVILSRGYLTAPNGSHTLPVYTILPVDPAEVQIEIDAADAAAVLKAVEWLIWGEADVFADGRYAFSVQVDAEGMWSIFQRDPDEGASFGEFG